MSLKIVTYPNPLLGKPSLPITEVTDEIRKLAEEMTEAMYKSDGIGIAAPLVCLRIFGSGSFLIPSMVCILVALLLFRRPIEAKESEAAK